MTDIETINVYNAQAAEYAARFSSTQPDAFLQRFIDALPHEARVLDLGCGPATASAHMRAAGLRPDPVDASSEMVALANNTHDINARLCTFDDIDAKGTYDGIWANFSLLHAKREDLPSHLSALHKALKSGGLFHIGMKQGKGEGRDRLDRFYTYVTEEELLSLLTTAGFQHRSSDFGKGKGLAGRSDPWIIMTAHG